MSPLTGFMRSDQLDSVLSAMRLPDGLPWTLPVILSATNQDSRSFREGRPLALENRAGRVLGTLTLEERHPLERAHLAEAVFSTTSESHPGVRWLAALGEVLLGGEVTLLEQPGPQRYRRDPTETREAFRRLGWRRVVGFQTRNPIHRAHEFVLKTALETADGLLIHPLVGETKNDDLPAEVRMKCYEVLLETYFVQQRTCLAVFPAWMRYAGPREAVFHALVRKNYGCTHFIVGRDHAGVGGFYDPFEAQKIFSNFRPEELVVEPLFFDQVFYCRRCDSMVSIKTCPHPGEHRVELSGSEVRRMLRRGELPPPEYSRPEVSRLLLEHSSS